MGEGEPEFSTCLALDVSPRIVWDTNGFYRALGVSVDAGRRELAAAYLSLQGHDSIRLTHIIKTLLHPVTRSRYDHTPLGMMWADDPALAAIVADVVEGGCVTAVGHDSEWAAYALGVDELDWELVGEWRTAVCLAWGQDGHVSRMAVGLSFADMEPHVRQVGQRSVAFLPTGVAIKQTSEYARLLVAQLGQPANR